MIWFFHQQERGDSNSGALLISKKEKLLLSSLLSSFKIRDLFNKRKDIKEKWHVRHERNF